MQIINQKVKIKGLENRASTAVIVLLGYQDKITIGMLFENFL